jgi:hypothetical protein
VRILVEAAQEHRIDLRPELRRAAARRLRLGLHLAERLLGEGARPAERQRSGEELVGDDRERVPVTRGRRGLTYRLLGGDVGRGSQQLPTGGESFLVGRPRDPEVRDDHSPLSVEEQVVRLDVPVNDAVRVREVERRGRVREPPDGVTALDPSGLEPVANRAAR